MILDPKMTTSLRAHYASPGEQVRSSNNVPTMALHRMSKHFLFRSTISKFKIWILEYVRSIRLIASQAGRQRYSHAR